jgi:hypothetical protein
MMSVITKLAGQQGRRDEEPNKNLAKELVEKQDVDGLEEIAQNLWNDDKRIRSDCVSVLEQVGHLAPELIEPYCADFLRLLNSKNNRLVWGAMINLSLIADRKPQEIYAQFDDITQAIVQGSVITQDSGVKTLALVAAAGAEYNEAVFPFLLAHLQSCRPKSVPQYAESMMRAVTPDNKEKFMDVLDQRLVELSSSQQKRVKRLFKTLGRETS